MDDRGDVAPGEALRDAAAQGFLMVPGVPNALAARLAQQQGFQAVYLSGAALSAGVLALPDVGLFTLTELVTQATFLTRSVNVPLIVDADTGFGESVQVQRTIVELEGAGVAAIQLEDQQLPKRCGHLSGKTLVEPATMAAKLRAAVAARDDPSLVLIARTDARGVSGLAEAVDRARRYVDAGADWIFPEALASEDEFAEFAEQVPVPLLANMTEFGKSPLLPADTLSQLGYAAAIYPVTLLRVATRAMQAALSLLRTAGSQTELLELMQTRQELYDLLEYDDFEQQDRGFFSPDDLDEKTPEIE